MLSSLRGRSFAHCLVPNSLNISSLCFQIQPVIFFIHITAFDTYGCNGMTRIQSNSYASVQSIILGFCDEAAMNRTRDSESPVLYP